MQNIWLFQNFIFFGIYQIVKHVLIGHLWNNEKVAF